MTKQEIIEKVTEILDNETDGLFIELFYTKDFQTGLEDEAGKEFDLSTFELRLNWSNRVFK